MALELAFMDGVLPQGTPASPLITTIMMIPIDFCLNRKLIERKSRFKDLSTQDTLMIFRFHQDMVSISKR